MNNLKVSTRIFTSFALMLLLLVCMGGVALVKMDTMDSIAKELSSIRAANVNTVASINTGTSGLRIYEVAHILNTDLKVIEQLDAKLIKQQAKVADLMGKYLTTDESPAAEKDRKKFIETYANYLKLSEKMLEYSRKNENVRALAMLEGESEVAYDALTVTTDDWQLEMNASAAEATSQANAAYEASRIAMLVCTVVAAILAVGVALWLVRSITVPLAGATQLAERVSEGDLTTVVQMDRHDEFGVLMQTLSKMQNNLGSLVSQVRQSSNQVANASNEIAMGNQDLSDRTEQQASELAQTASSMEKLDATVKTNADSAQQANQLASRASTIAVQGGEVVGQVVNTMKSINDASHKISEIISVIDGIAFQTNILALNAAVEAARAGEHGRGFAVVASEVRALAGRSADAAKEIKRLISDNETSVEQGTQLVTKAGQTMTEVVDSIKRVTDIMSEINAATAEQNKDVSVVVSSVNTIDQTTQQNAALVEQMAAAASGLKSQSQDLVTLVSVFKVDGAAPSGASGAQAALPSHKKQTADPFPSEHANGPRLAAG